MYIAAYSKSKSRKDRALLEPLERPPYHQRRFGVSLGHLEHWVSGVWAAAAPPGPRRYASVVLAGPGAFQEPNVNRNTFYT